jgi:hypothetical protein
VEIMCPSVTVLGHKPLDRFLKIRYRRLSVVGKFRISAMLTHSKAYFTEDHKWKFPCVQYTVLQIVLVLSMGNVCKKFLGKSRSSSILIRSKA